MPLVLVENDVRIEGHDWKDATGIVYHFPNMYRSRVESGDRFIYYKGVAREDGRRARAGYFGVGRVGDVWKDEEQAIGRASAWYAAIQDYVPFQEQVNARREDGSYFEQPPGNSRNMYFRNGVRVISDEVFDTIMAEARLQPLLSDPPLGEVESGPENDIDHVRVVPVEAGLLSPAPKRADQERAVVAGRSRRAKQIGDRAEAVVYRWLTENGFQVTWVAQQGQKPGWDMEYLDGGQLVRVEVKGSVTGQVVPVEFTRNEMAAALNHKSQYYLYLVADCFSSAPKVQAIRDPANTLITEPATWWLWRPD